MRREITYNFGRISLLEGDGKYREAAGGIKQSIVERVIATDSFANSKSSGTLSALVSTESTKSPRTKHLVDHPVAPANLRSNSAKQYANLKRQQHPDAWWCLQK